MILKLTNEEIREILNIDSPEFPKCTTQLLNLANQNAQGTRPNVVGQLSDLIQQFKGRTLSEWEEWYLERYPDAIHNASKRIEDMINKFREALSKIDHDLIEKWVRDLVIVKTFLGLRFQEAILRAIAKKSGKTYRLSVPEEESKGIDGYIGDEPVSIKPATYKSKQALPESISMRIIYYDKDKDGISTEF